MGVFADVTLNWDGKDYVIPAKKVLRAIGRVESVLTIKELYAATSGGDIKFERIATAYGEALRFAGAPVDDDDVYAGLFAGQESQETIIQAISGLLAIMIPPSAMKEAADATPGKAPVPAKTKAAAPSSRKRSS